MRKVLRTITMLFVVIMLTLAFTSYCFGAESLAGSEGAGNVSGNIGSIEGEIESAKAEWEKTPEGMKYKLEDGSYALGWMEIQGKWYYFNSYGYMQTGWQYTGGKWYYMNTSGVRQIGWQYINGYHYYLYEDGHMASNERTPDGFYVCSSGAWIKDKWMKNSTGWWYEYGEGNYAIGWHEIAGKWYYFDSYGYMQTGWQYIAGKWYYMNASGARLTGWQNIGGKSYYLYEDGHMASNEKTPDGYYVMSDGAWLPYGWIKNSVGWWYHIDRGEYSVGWHNVSGKWYYFNSSGYMQTGWQYIAGKWYYMNASGARLTGWQNIGGKSYYLYEDGHMAANGKTPDGYYVMSDGAWLPYGWIKNSVGWWYHIDNEKYPTGWYEISGSWYYFNSYGYMQTGWQYLSGNWYFLKGSGAMATGLTRVDGFYYYFYSDGHMAANEVTPDGYTIEPSGIWLDSSLKRMISKANQTRSSTGYLMVVDCSAHKVGIFTGSNGNWKYSMFWNCTTGTSQTPTIKGTFKIGGRGYYFDSYGSRCFWWTRFCNEYLFHSVLYDKNGNLMDGRLGMSLSHGCIRLKIENAKWIHDNIPRGTTVVIY